MMPSGYLDILRSVELENHFPVTQLVQEVRGQVWEQEGVNAILSNVEPRGGQEEENAEPEVAQGQTVIVWTTQYFREYILHGNEALIVQHADNLAGRIANGFVDITPWVERSEEGADQEIDPLTLAEARREEHRRNSNRQELYAYNLIVLAIESRRQALQESQRALQPQREDANYYTPPPQTGWGIRGILVAIGGRTGMVFVGIRNGIGRLLGYGIVPREQQTFWHVVNELGDDGIVNEAINLINRIRAGEIDVQTLREGAREEGAVIRQTPLEWAVARRDARNIVYGSLAWFAYNDLALAIYRRMQLFENPQTLAERLTTYEHQSITDIWNLVRAAIAIDSNNGDNSHGREISFIQDSAPTILNVNQRPLEYVTVGHVEGQLQVRIINLTFLDWATARRTAFIRYVEDQEYLSLGLAYIDMLDQHRSK